MLDILFPEDYFFSIPSSIPFSQSGAPSCVPVGGGLDGIPLGCAAVGVPAGAILGYLPGACRVPAEAILGTCRVPVLSALDARLAAPPIG